MRDIESNKYLELLDDELFIEWILFPNDELDAYWRQRISDNPDLSDNIESLRFIILNLKVEKKQMSQHAKSQILDELQKNNFQKTSSKTFRRFFLRIVTSAAAVLLVIGSVWLFRSSQNAVTEIDYQSMLAEYDINEQSGSVELILDNTSRVRIDSTNADIVYSGTGEININSEKIDKGLEVQFNQLIIPYGKTSSITLSDGSRIWANSGSRLIYPLVFEGEKREIYVEGEIYIEVEKGEKPFLIKTDNFEVRVMGTKFNVSAYKNDREHSVVLVSGSVSVEDKLTNNTDKILPNQRYAYNLKNGSTTIQNVNINEHISWKSGYLALKSEELNTILNKLERYYNVTFLYNSEETKDIRVSGKLNLKDNINDILKAISITTPMHYEITEKNIQLKF